MITLPPGVTVRRDYLNKTANKDARLAYTLPLVGNIWHETETPNPHNPQGTLEYNLATGPKRGTRGSYNFLIDIWGVLWFYLDWEQWVAWHAGDSAALGYTDYEVSVHTFSVEVDSKCDGTPPTPAQWKTMIAVARWLHTDLGIPLDVQHHLAHKAIALPPGRKHDPAGYTVADLVQRALAAG